MQHTCENRNHQSIEKSTHTSKYNNYHSKITNMRTTGVGLRTAAEHHM